jgi:hypothetical protein
VTQTSLNYTGQKKDDTGLLYYHARMYDPALARFVSPDSIVPGASSGAGGVGGTVGQEQNSMLTVDFHESGFLTSAAGENATTLNKGFWFQLGEGDKQRVPYGSENSQALNRYAYVLDNPVRYIDPTGHSWCICIAPMLHALGCLLFGCSPQPHPQQAAIDAGEWVPVVGGDGVTRFARSAVNQGPQALQEEAKKLRHTEAGKQINDILDSFLRGNTKAGLGGLKHLDANIWYLRGSEGGRVFLRHVGENRWEIIAWANKGNEPKVINLINRYYLK